MWSYIFDSQVSEWIMRFNLLKTHGINSFGKLFDDLPVLWIEVLDLISTELYKAQEDKRRLENG